jgi:hypothetical protein
LRALRSHAWSMPPERWFPVMTAHRTD